MDKLIELLNERDIKYWSKRKRYFVPNRICWEWCDNSECSDLLIISEKFWFIWWLVDNDKIDLLKLTCMNPRYTEILDSDFSWEDRIIMILSIQDNPIEFLISILKIS